MSDPDGTYRRSLHTGLLGSYIADLSQWARRIATGYAMAAAILVVGGCFTVVAFGIGAAALFHWLEINYGPYIAYGGFGGLFLLLGIACIIVGLQSLKRSIPSVPRPRRQIQALQQAIAVPAASRVLARINAGDAVKPDRITQTLAGTAAVVLLGWIATSYIRRPSAQHREPT
jgi:putative superfamily III holin-X